MTWCLPAGARGRWCALPAFAALVAGAAIAGCGTDESPVARLQPVTADQIASAADADIVIDRTEVPSFYAPHGGQIEIRDSTNIELVYEGLEGRFTVYLFSKRKATPIEEQQFDLQVRDEATARYHRVAMTAAPLEGEAEGTTSRFVGSDPKLRKLLDFTAVARIALDGEMHRLNFVFADGQPVIALPPLDADAVQAEQFACPMLCETDDEGLPKIYPKSRRCPVCGMKLEEYKNGKFAHDHTPRRGGIFFMAADQFHHVEAILPRERELRIYLYNNFIEHLDATGISGELEVQPVTEEDEEIGPPITLPIEPGPNDQYLLARLPLGIEPPYWTTARIQFPGAPEPFNFNFDFKNVHYLPRHGGVLALAPDKVHWLEAVSAGDGKLRVYLYDRTTKPLPISGMSGELEVTPVDEIGDEVGPSLKASLVAGSEDEHMTALLSEGIERPFRVTARIQLPGQEEPAELEFDFKTAEQENQSHLASLAP